MRMRSCVCMAVSPTNIIYCLCDNMLSLLQPHFTTPRPADHRRDLCDIDARHARSLVFPSGHKTFRTLSTNNESNHKVAKM